MSERHNRLERLASAASPAEFALAALDGAESAALAEWSANAEGQPPAPDVEARARLAREAEVARATSDAARRAADLLAASRAGVAAKIDRAGPAVAMLACEIVVAEVLSPLAVEVAAAVARLATLKQRLADGREAVLRATEADLSAPGRTDVLRAVERLDSEIRDATAPPAPADEVQWRSAFADHLRALASDPAATFDADAPAAPFDPDAAFARARDAYMAKAGVAA